MGMMPGDFILSSLLKKENYFLDVAISHYINRYCDIPILSKHQKELKFMTVSLNDFSFSEKKDTIVKIKGSSKYLESITKWSHSYNGQWAVDFNCSLEVREFQKFLIQANLRNCFFIEEPLLLSEPIDYLFNAGVDIWIDERLKDIDLSSKSNDFFSGAFIKPILYKYNSLLEIIHDLNNIDKPFIISSVICDNLYHNFLIYLNSISPIKLILENSPNFLVNELEISENPYVSNNFSRCIKEIKKNYFFSHNFSVVYDEHTNTTAYV
jgi:hypothetical protein